MRRGAANPLAKPNGQGGDIFRNSSRPAFQPKSGFLFIKIEDRSAFGVGQVSKGLAERLIVIFFAWQARSVVREEPKQSIQVAGHAAIRCLQRIVGRQFPQRREMATTCIIGKPAIMAMPFSKESNCSQKPLPGKAGGSRYIYLKMQSLHTTRLLEANAMPKRHATCPWFAHEAVRPFQILMFVFRQDSWMNPASQGSS